MPKKEIHTIVKSIALTAPFLVIGFAFSFVFVFTAWASGIAPADVIALTNNAREKEGLKPLVVNAQLAAAAQDKAEDMLKNDYFAHISPAGVDPWHWFKIAGYDYQYAGENLAVNYASASAQQGAWMNSTTHRANILNAQYQEIGVATVQGKIDGVESLITVALFGTQVVVVADQSRAAVPPVVQPVATKAAIPRVEGTEITAAPLAPHMTSAAPLLRDAQLFLSWTKTYTQTRASVLAEQFGQVRWGVITQAMAITFLMLAVLLGPLAFLYKAAEIIVRVARESGGGRSLIADTIALPQATFGTLPQHIRRDTPLIHDIRPG
ncbi:MAG: CAP domain-containing protein [Candidatus Moraniibacteriota bacterium]